MILLAKIRLLIIRIIMYPFLCVLGVTLKTDSKIILFSSFKGKSYSGNPRYLFEYIKNSGEFSDYQLVWAFKDVKSIAGAKTVKFNSFQYFYYLSKAKYWIFNSKMAPYYYKKSDQVYLQTWHGVPLKRLGHDIIDNGSTYYRSKQSYKQMVKSYDKDSRHWDYLIASSPFSAHVFETAFAFPQQKMLNVGYPRVDCLVQPDPARISELKKKYHLPINKKIILYAPTWRDNSYNNAGYTFELKVNFYSWKRVLGEEYIVLFKPHYLICSTYHIPQDLSDFVFLMDPNQDISDAYLVSDALITDYSSVFFDYAQLERPIYFYMYDLGHYAKELRGFYLKVPDDLPNNFVKTEEELLKMIKDDYFDYQRLRAFNERFNPWNDGSACEKIVSEVFYET
ncbi:MULTISPECIES: CDP-glycerol glycerophosphotransferase family protein [Lactococcus]|uniref:CDP-glycerol glycerophosphotransferase family protein n=1 Tax=Lactococcus petauri TaxID=1940789 RepID=A0AAJ2IZK2_9LACT|nr:MULTISPECIES: CDP-glycerol glycerophosphotransferase family protein [Lactococcus]MCH1713483.1 CDP-glycerol glycerophosphotransferase family protein [Lactococcus petauri]MDT2526964.1 CDP-glycerol glycerophosphotransferase family protein [Lactococcus petauri]MDT2541508.1 CDP-glycerol glycerophosphotransferase family protein [Lactococcus petauri]MDT2558004.1 CDP-glycerol glycerophosphotransferase family protein [Lactococcus petauri]MDT2560135.1 CDP-glycerol glycerophosphotransferase family pro